MRPSTVFSHHLRRARLGSGSCIIRAKSFSYVFPLLCLCASTNSAPQKFYWNGVKLINTHRKRVRDIEARIASGGASLSRREKRFIAQYKQDALK